MTKDYLNYNLENLKDVPQIYSTLEHGWQGNYFHIYNELEKFNEKYSKEWLDKDKTKRNPNYDMNFIPKKFIFGTEAYWVKDRHEKDKSNNHICLFARNDNGRKKINRAIYESFKTGFYFKGRMDLDILLSLPQDDVFVTSACIGYWLDNKGEWVYDDIDEITLKLNEHFTHFYLEVQASNNWKQNKVNSHIIELSRKYNIPIIAGADTHFLNENGLKDREDLVQSLKYDNDCEFYMDYPSLQEFIERFKTQGILTEDEIYDAINNTNLFLQFEDIVLDRSLKVPVAKKYKDLTLEQRNHVFEDILRKEWNLQKSDINKDKYDEYVKEIKHDIGEIEGCSMADYFIINYEVCKLAINKYNGRLTPSGRGSGVATYINKLLGFTKVDKVNAPVAMYSERFLTKERILESKTPPDIDHNVSEREPFIQAQRDVICTEGTFDLLALGTLKYKSAFKMYARAYNLEPSIANEVTSQISKYEEALKYANDDDIDLIEIFDYVDEKKYGNLINGCKKYMGIVDNLKSHPCFTKDALVMTDIGYKKINEVNVGDNVLTINHHFKKVLKTMNRESNDIYSLVVQGSTPIEVTGNHPFYTSRRIFKRGDYSGKKDRRELSDKKWKSVESLEKGDLIGIAINKKEILPDIPFVDSNLDDFWWSIGRYLGDGWRSHTVRRSGREKGQKIKDVIICCNKNNNETDDILKHLTWCESRVSETETTNKIYLKKEGLYDWLDQFGDYAGNKHLTNEIIDLPKEQLSSLLDGYFSADGHYEKKTNRQLFTTISKELGLGIIACVNKVYERPCSFVIRKKAGVEYIQGRKVNCKEKYSGSFSYEDRPQDRAFVRDGYIWTPYKSKTKINKKETVYNLEVEGNHTYTVNNLIVHNCGTICYDGDAIEDIGVIMVKSKSAKDDDKEAEHWVAVIESGTIDSFGYLKQDYLIVDSIGLIYDIYEDIGINPYTINQLSSKTKDDKKTWDIYKNGLTICVNQIEQLKSSKKAQKYKPKNIPELCQFIAGIRPGFKTMYKIFESREHFDYGIKTLDNLIQTDYCSSSFIIFQEDLMRILAFAGFEMKDTYTIIKAISKKKDYIIKEAKSKFIPNFTKAIIKTGETNNLDIATDLAEKVWKVIEDNADYGFNTPHAYCMATDSLTLAYLKAHYPLNFYKVSMQRYTKKGNKNKVQKLEQEMKNFDIKIIPSRFRQDNREFSINKEDNTINAPISRIKNTQKIAGQLLYQLKDIKTSSFLDFLFELHSKKINNNRLDSRSLDILIKLNYFEEFGHINYLLKCVSVANENIILYDKLKKCKQLHKNKFSEEQVDEIRKYANKETAKLFKEFDNEALVENIFPLIKQDCIDDVPHASKSQMASWEIQLLGYTDIIDKDADMYHYIVQDLETNKWGNTFVNLYSIQRGTSGTLKVNKKMINKLPIEEGDVLNCLLKLKNKRRKIDNVWTKTDEKEWILEKYNKISIDK